MQTLQLLVIGEQDQLVFRPRGGHINQFLVVFQPLVSLRAGFVGQGQRKNHHILFVSLKGMNRPAGSVAVMLLGQHLLDQFPLTRKGRNDPDGFFRVLAQIPIDQIHLRRGRVLFCTRVMGQIHIDQGPFAFPFACHLQFLIVVLFIVEGDDFRITAIVIPQKHLVADRIAGQKAGINGISEVIVLLPHMVSLSQHLIVLGVQQNHRPELLRVSYQHQRVSPYNRHQGDCRVALAGLVHNHHIEGRFGVS